MIPKSLGALFWMLSLVGVVVFFRGSAEQLSDPIATTFDGGGVATGSMTSAQYSRFFFGMLIFLNAIFAGLGAIGIRYLPFSIINIPNKVYWAEHQEEGKARLAAGMFVFAAGINVLLASSHLLILQKNGVETGWPELSMVVFLGGAFLGMLLLFANLLLGLRTPKS